MTEKVKKYNLFLHFTYKLTVHFKLQIKLVEFILRAHCFYVLTCKN